MSLFISIMSSFDYDARDKSMKREAEAVMSERRLMLKVERHLSLAENSSSKHWDIPKN